MIKRVLAVLAVVVVIFVGTANVWFAINPIETVADSATEKCRGKTKGPDDDSRWTWDEGSVDIPCDENIYTITGTITSAESMVRQIAPASGSGSCSYYGGIGGGYGGCSSWSRGEIIDGKGYVLLTVESSDSPYAPAGATVILKTSDTKAVFIPEGYRSTFKCRHEYEAVAALVDMEKFDDWTLDEVRTDELDFCRMVNPIIYPPLATATP